MKREEFLEALADCIKTEESAIPIYSKHVGNTLFLSEFSAGEKRSVLAILDMLTKESQRHSQVLTELIEKIRQEGRDVY